MFAGYDASAPSCVYCTQSIPGKCLLLLNRSHETLELNLTNALQFHDLLKHKYVNYFENAPPSWQEDDFFRTHRPLSITTRYGQNQPLHMDNALAEDCWENDRNFDRIRRISFAIATDIR